MRPLFFQELHKWMAINKDIWVISIDLGYGGFDKIREDYPDRFINTGAAEQAAMGIAVGLALKGKIPFIYSITPFLLWRAAETIRNYIHHERIPVKLVGSGRDDDYEHDGFSHNAEDDRLLIATLHKIKPMWPTHKESIPDCVRRMVERKIPFYLNLSKKL